MSNQDLVNCRNCGHISAVDPSNSRCLDCGEMVCLHCGCTNDTACNDGGQGCYWVRAGLCSACED